MTASTSDYQELISGIMVDWDVTGYVALRSDAFAQPSKMTRSWVAMASVNGVTEVRFLEQAHQYSDLGELTDILRSATCYCHKVEYVVYPVYGCGFVPSWKRLYPDCRGTCPAELLQRKFVEDRHKLSVDRDFTFETPMLDMGLHIGDTVTCVNSSFVCVDEVKFVFVGQATGWRLELEEGDLCVGTRTGRVSKCQFDRYLEQLRQVDRHEHDPGQLG